MVSPFLWMLRVDRGVRGLGDDLRRRWSEKPLTAADADNPNAAAESVGARAENELRVVAGAYRPHVPPGARAAYDRTTDEVAEAVNKQTSDAFRARARAAHEEGARATFDATREQLVAAHDEAVRDGDHPRAETLAGQIADLDHFRRAYLRAEGAAKTAAPGPAQPSDEPPKAQPAPSEAPVPAAVEPVSPGDPPPTPPAPETPAPGHDPGALMPGSADADTAKALSPDTPKGITARDRVPPTKERDFNSVATGDEFGNYDAPTDHARALRGLFLEIPHLGRRGADGKPLATPEEFDAHLEKSRPHIRPEHFAAYEAIVRRLQAGEISALAAERELRELYEVIPEWEQTAELVLDLLPFIGGGKAAIEFFVAMRRLDEAITVGDEKEADRLSLEAAGLFIALGIGGTVRIPGLARLAAKLPGAPELAAWLRQRQARKNERKLVAVGVDEKGMVDRATVFEVAKLDRKTIDIAESYGTVVARREGNEASRLSILDMRARKGLGASEPGHPPWVGGAVVVDVTAKRDVRLVRLTNHTTDGRGSWLIPYEEFLRLWSEGGAKAVHAAYAIPGSRANVSIVTVPAGTRMSVGPARGHEYYGHGRAIQIELIDPPKRVWFAPPQPRDQWRP